MREPGLVELTPCWEVYLFCVGEGTWLSRKCAGGVWVDKVRPPVAAVVATKQRRCSSSAYYWARSAYSSVVCTTLTKNRHHTWPIQYKERGLKTQLVHPQTTHDPWVVCGWTVDVFQERERGGSRHDKSSTHTAKQTSRDVARRHLLTCTQWRRTLYNHTTTHDNGWCVGAQYASSGCIWLYPMYLLLAFPAPRTCRRSVRHVGYKFIF